MTNNPKTDDEVIKPNLESPVYRQLLQTVHKETPDLHLLSLVDIDSGQIYALPDEAAVEQAMLACCLFNGLEIEAPQHLGDIGDCELSCYRIGEYQLMALPRLEAVNELIVIAFADHAQLSRLRQLSAEVTAALSADLLAPALAANRAVVRAWSFNAETGALLESYQRLGSENNRRLAAIDGLDATADVFPLTQTLLTLAQSGARTWLDGLLVIVDGHVLRWHRMPFILDHVLFTDTPVRADGEQVAAAMFRAQNDILRQVIADTLASGLETKTEPFPATDIEFSEVLGDLRELEKSDLRGRLVHGGFADHPLNINDIHMRCMECIYFLPNRRWCDLPELPVPVEPDWYCRLWKM